ncbi:MAG: class I SAM-dependent methyltransferase [Nanoarchaeota archaeon]
MDKSKQAITIYEKIAVDYAKKFTTLTDYFVDFAKLLPSRAKILDLGCGPGLEAVWLASKEYFVIGVDYSHEMIRLAKKRTSKVIFRHGDMRRANFPSGKFDALVLSYSLIHIPKKNIASLLRKTYSWLKKEGIIYVAIQAGRSQEVFLSEPFKPDEKIFLNILSQRELIEALKDTGFSIIKQFKRKAVCKEELGYTKFVVFAKK